MARNSKFYEKKRIKIEKSIMKDTKIIEAIRKGGKLEIIIKNGCVEFWRKERGKERELVSHSEGMCDNIICIRSYYNKVLSLIDEERYDEKGNPNTDYKAFLTINDPNRKASIKLQYI